MKIRFALGIALAVACLGLGSARASAQKLYPVQGPLASHTPALVFSGHRPAFSAGCAMLEVRSWTFVDGEELEGKCSAVKAASLNPKTPGAPDSYPPQPDLAFAWDAVYGQGYFVSHIMGQKIGQAIYKGNKGTVLQMETLDDRSGVAVDNLGNVYKLLQ